MQQPRKKPGMARTGVALAAALVLALASHSVAAEPKGQSVKPAVPGVAPRTAEVGEMLYGTGGGAWGSPSRNAARLARQREIQDKARETEFEQQAVAPAGSGEGAALKLPLPPTLEVTNDAAQMAQWLIPLGGGIVIGLGVAGIYSWNRSRSLIGLASSQLMVVSAGSPVPAAAGHSSTQMGVIPNVSRRRLARRGRSVQSRMMSFPKLRIRPSRDLQGDAIRQLQTLGVVPVQLGQMSPGIGRPAWFANAITDEVQMYGGGSDPIPNYAYLEDAPRMLAQVEHQKAAEAMVWSNQQWQR